jgi:N-acetylglutamate synthase-like GNAT family acetyltransferase
MVKIKKAGLHEIKEVFLKEWCTDYIVTKGNIIKYNDVKGFTAKENNNLIGLITYIKRENEIEITSLNSFVENKGIGTRLLEYIIKIAKKKISKEYF